MINCEGCDRRICKNITSLCQDCYWQRRRTFYDPEEVRETILASKRNWYYNNREHSMATSRNWKEANKDKIREYNDSHKEERRSYVEARRARLLAVSSDLTGSDWKRLIEAYDHQCAYCLEKFDKLEQDHVIPLSLGGSHTIDNVVPACLPCNRQKGTSLLIPKHELWNSLGTRLLHWRLLIASYR